MQLSSPENVCETKHEIHDKSVQNESPKPPQKIPGRPKLAQTCPRGFQKAPKSDKEASRGRRDRFSHVIQLKIGAQRHPRGGQGVQN